ncbi:MAG: hypothetical protein EXR62_06050 [Chloroflexi bacterium]|nr:hypothetical protein [Chloroflexota bacterium]
MKRSLGLALALSLGLAMCAAILTLPIHASPSQRPQAQLFLSSTTGGSPQAAFPSGISAIYAKVVYTDTSGTDLIVTLTDGASNVMFNGRFTANGTSTRVFTITGQTVFDQYFQDAQQNATNSRAVLSSALVETDISRLRELIARASGDASQMKRGVDRLLLFTLPAAAVSKLNEVKTSLATVTSIAATSAARPNPTVAQLHQDVAQMQDAIVAAATALDSARSLTGPLNNATIPNTDPCQPDTAQLTIEGFRAQSLEFTIRNVGTPTQVESRNIGAKVYAQNVTVPGVAHTVPVTVSITDGACVAVVNGTPVTFTSLDPTKGTVNPPVANTFTIGDGMRGIAVSSFTAGAEEGNGQTPIQVSAGLTASVQVTVTVIGRAAPGHVVIRSGVRNAQINGAPFIVDVDVTDKNNNAVANGAIVTLNSDPAGLVTFDQGSKPIQDGRVSFTVTPGGTTGMVTLQATADGQTGTFQVSLVGPPASVVISATTQLIILSSPNKLAGISAFVRDASGHLAADGTQVTFSANPPSVGDFDNTSVPVRNGLATAQFSGKAVGDATITAMAGSASGTTTITVADFDNIMVDTEQNGAGRISFPANTSQLYIQFRHRLQNHPTAVRVRLYHWDVNYTQGISGTNLLYENTSMYQGTRTENLLVSASAVIPGATYFPPTSPGKSYLVTLDVVDPPVTIRTLIFDVAGGNQVKIYLPWSGKRATR